VLTEGLLIAVVTGLVAVLVELIRNRKRQDRVVHEVSPNSGSSMKDQLERVEALLTALGVEVEKLKQGQARNGERLAGLEAVGNGRRWYR
jgi:hypothetical protein